MTPTHAYLISFRNHCQYKFCILATFPTVPFSQLRVMDSGAHQRIKGMERVLIKSVSIILFFKSFYDTRSFSTRNTNEIQKGKTFVLCFVVVFRKCSCMVLLHSPCSLLTKRRDTVGNTWLWLFQNEASHMRQGGFRERTFLSFMQM